MATLETSEQLVIAVCYWFDGSLGRERVSIFVGQIGSERADKAFTKDPIIRDTRTCSMGVLSVVNVLDVVDVLRVFARVLFACHGAEGEGRI